MSNDKVLDGLDNFKQVGQELNAVSDVIVDLSFQFAELGLFRTYVCGRYPEVFKEAELWVEENVLRREEEAKQNVS